MKESSPTLKNRKPSVYIFFALYCLFGALILGESAVPSAVSATQSNSFASALAWVVNLFSPSIEGQSIAPKSLVQTGDTTLLSPAEDGTPRIALGTTSLLTFQVAYPEKGQFDFYDQAYSVTRLVGEEGAFDLLPSQNTASNVISLRVTGKEVASMPYELKVTAGKLSADYSFYIVDLPRPNPTQYDASIAKTTLKVGESEVLDVRLKNPDADTPVHRSDWYLRRYYDVSKIFSTAPDFVSSDPSVLSLDTEGMLHALKEGQVTLSSSEQTLQVTVEGSLTSSTPSFILAKANEHVLCMNDYDFLAESDSKGNITSYFSRSDKQVYWTTLYGDFGTDDLSSFDSSLVFSSSDSRLARVFPYTIDPVSQTPSWRDALGRPACQVVGYRLPKNSAGMVQITATSSSKASQSLTLEVTQAIPNGPQDGSWLKTSQGKTLSGSIELSSNAQLFLVGDFTPANTGNKALHGVSGDSSVVKILGNDSATLVLEGVKEGMTNLVVSSLANPSLSVTLQVSVKNPQVVNESNFDSIASFLRKAAGHFTLFLVSAVIGLIFFNLFFADPKKDWLGLSLGTGVGFLLAAFSELIQYLGNLWFSFGRSGNWADIGIDTLGYAIGAFLCWGAILLIRLIEKKKKAAKGPSVNPPDA